MTRFALSRRSFLISSLACVGPGAAYGFIAPSDSKSLLGASRAPLIDLDRTARDLRRPPAPPQDIPQTQPTPDTPPAASDLADLADLAGVVPVDLRNVHTSETLHIRFHPANGGLLPDQPEALDHFLRDWRRNRAIAIDPGVTDSLARVVREARRHGWTGQVQINSGYRTRETNSALRRKGIGAARNSLHLTGQAIDFALPGLTPAKIGAMARQLLPGGIGTYATFVHIDSGKRRSWQG